MALSFARVTSNGLPYRVTRSERETITDCTFDSSYTTNGLAVTAANLGLNKIHEVVLCSVKTPSPGAAANIFFDDVNSKLKAFTTTAEVANAVDLSALVVRVIARGV